MDIMVADYGYGSLASAISLFTKGYNVTLFDMGSGITCPHSKEIFPSGPYSAGRLIPTIFDMAEILPFYQELKFEKALVIEDLVYQVVMPSHRISIYRNKKLFMEELEREFPNDLANIKGFFRKMDNILDELKRLRDIKKCGFIASCKKDISQLYKGINSLLTLREACSTTVAQELNADPYNEDFKTFIELQLRFFLQQSCEHTKLILYSLLYNLQLEGFSRYFNSQDNLFNVFEKFIKEHHIETVNAENFSTSEIRSWIPKFDYIIVDCAHPLVKDYLEDNFNINNNFYAKIGFNPGSLILWGLNFTVSKSVIPENIAHDVIVCHSKNSPLCGTNVVYLSFAKNLHIPEENVVTGSASILLPKSEAHKISNDPNYRNTLSNEIIEVIQDVIPFWEEGNVKHGPSKVYYVSECNYKANLYKLMGIPSFLFPVKDFARHLKFKNILLVNDLYSGWIISPPSIHLGIDVANKI